MKLKFFSTSILILFVFNLNAENIYTVDELIIKALKNSPDLKISSLQYNASKERLNIASSNYLPKVDLHAQVGFNGMSDVPNDNMLDDTLLLGNLSLKQILYDFGKTGENVNIYKYDSKSFSMSNMQYISNKKMDVKLAYYDVLKAKALIDVNRENVKLNKAQLYRSQKYFTAGIRTKIDISDAEVELIKSKLDLQNTQYDLKLAYATLDKVVGFNNLQRNYNVYSKKLDLTNLFYSISNYDLTLTKSIEFAYKNRYELKQFSMQIQSAQASSKVASSQYYPALYFNADYTKQNVDKFKTIIPQDKWQASVNLDWNLYEGGATSSDLQEKEIQVAIAKSKLQNIKLSIKKDITQAFINVYKMKDSVELSQSLVKVSNEKFIQAGKRYENGLSDYIELQQARQGYIDAKASLVVSYYNYYAAIATLDNVIGR
ncbi:TolC family protein [Sulfurimonas sp.]